MSACPVLLTCCHHSALFSATIMWKNREHATIPESHTPIQHGDWVEDSQQEPRGDTASARILVFLIPAGLLRHFQPTSHSATILFFLFFKFKFNYPTYTTSLISDVVFNDSSVVYNTQRSTHHMPSLKPLTIAFRKNFPLPKKWNCKTVVKSQWQIFYNIILQQSPPESISKSVLFKSDS